MIYSLFDFADRAAGEEGRTFLDLPYMHTLCEALEDCVCGRLPNGAKNLLVTVPPRHYKTTFVSQYFPSWCHAEVAPDCEFILTSATAGLATDNAMAVNRIETARWYQELYTDTRISSRDRDLQGHFRTTAGGSIYATGLEGTITGYGAGKVRSGFGGAIIIDDPLKAGDAKSSVKRESCVRYYLDVLKSRRNNVHNTPFIVVAQRLHIDDLPGWLMKNEPNDWHVVNFAAVGQDRKLLNPVTTSLEELDQLKVVAPDVFYAQYQQQPIVPGGNIIKARWWTTYDPTVEKVAGARWITADTAYKATKTADQSVLQCWEATKDKLYFIDSMYGRWDFPTLLKNAELFQNIMKAREFWVEDKASGTPLAQTLEDLRLPAQAWNPHKFSFPDDKVGRMMEASWFVHGGRVALPIGNVPVRVDEDTVVHLTPGAAALVEEAALFARDMSHAHDDHCDTFTMAVSLYKDAL